MRSPTFAYERALLAKGCSRVAGVDEVGCGAWAGPVYAAAVILKPGKQLPHVRDSKQLSAEQRANLVAKIHSICLTYAYVSANIEEITQLNIRQASLLATQRALANLAFPPDWILSDAFLVPGDIPCTPIVRGDSLSKSIAAASILAKVERDAHMQQLDELYPGYSFGTHKGYGTKAHQCALAELGPSPIHRTSYAPIKKLRETQSRAVV